MNAWSIVINKQEERDLGEFLARSISGHWVEEEEPSQMIYRLLQTPEERAEQLVSMARTLARYLTGDYQRTWLEMILHRHYPYFVEKDQAEILRNADRYLHRDADHDGDREDLATLSMMNFLKDHDLLVLDGVANFLMPEIRLELEESIDRAVDELLLDREYDEFVGILRAFVERAEKRPPLINVYFQNQEFIIRDHQGARLSHEVLAQSAIGIQPKDADQDDLVISTLITLAPERVRLHALYEKTSELYQMLRAVFRENLEQCTNCDVCEAVLTEFR